MCIVHAVGDVVFEFFFQMNLENLAQMLTFYTKYPRTELKCS